MLVKMNTRETTEDKEMKTKEKLRYFFSFEIKFQNIPLTSFSLSSFVSALS